MTLHFCFQYRLYFLYFPVQYFVEDRVRYALKAGHIDLTKMEKVKEMVRKYSIKTGYQENWTPPLLDANGNDAAVFDDGEEGEEDEEADNLDSDTDSEAEEDNFDFMTLSNLIRVYDGDDDGALTIDEVFQWMEDARDSYGGEHGHPCYADAEMLVHAFDIDESDTLDSEELTSWIREGARLTEEERMKAAVTSPEMEKRGASHPRVMVFLGNILEAMEEALVSSLDCPPAGPDEIVLTLTSKSEEDGGLSGGFSIGPSLLVTAVMRGGVAEQAGVQVGHRIVRVGAENLISGVDGMTYVE